MPTIAETIAFIKMAQAGHTDQSGLDYYLHPVAVMNRLPAETDDEVRLAALGLERGASLNDQWR